MCETLQIVSGHEKTIYIALEELFSQITSIYHLIFRN